MIGRICGWEVSVGSLLDPRGMATGISKARAVSIVEFEGGSTAHWSRSRARSGGELGMGRVSGGGSARKDCRLGL